MNKKLQFKRNVIELDMNKKKKGFKPLFTGSNVHLHTIYIAIQWIKYVWQIGKCIFNMHSPNYPTPYR